MHDNEVCFNTNRAWTSDTALLKDLFPNFKMIVCLRDVPWVLDSFEQLNAKNPYTIKPLYHHQDLPTVHERCRILMGEMPNFGGYVHGPLLMTQQSMFCNEKNHICYLEYDTLVRNPKGCMKEIYEFLGEPWFEHDFDNVEDSYDEFDQQAKIEGLHTVRKKIEFRQRTTILPGELWEYYSQKSFWKYNPELQKSLKWITGKSKLESIAITQQPAAPRQAPASPQQMTRPYKQL